MMLSFGLISRTAGRDGDAWTEVQVTDHGADVDVVLSDGSFLLAFEALRVLGRTAVVVVAAVFVVLARLVNVLLLSGGHGGGSR